MAWIRVVGIDGFGLMFVASKVSFLAGLEILFLARVCIGCALVTDGCGAGCARSVDDTDGVGCVFRFCWLGDGSGWVVWVSRLGEGEVEGELVEVSGCTCAELVIVLVESIPEPKLLFCS